MSVSEPAASAAFPRAWMARGSRGDARLARLATRGDSRAFEAIYDRHGGPAFSLAYRMVGNRVIAEDITQEAFLSIWRSRLRYESERGSVRSWVLGIVHHRTIDALISRVNARITTAPQSSSCIQRTRITSDLVMIKVLSVLKSRTRTAGLWGVIIVDSRSSGVETSTKGNAGCMIVSTGCAFTSGLRTSAS